MTSPLQIFREIIFRNELGANENLIYKFSDPDGIRTGKSGYSFGVCQFDTQNNPWAILCLRECGFTTDQIRMIKSQNVSPKPFEYKLIKNRETVDAWDNRQLKDCLTQVNIIRAASELDLSRETIYHLADYHNQFYLSIGGKMHTFLRSLQRTVYPEDIFDFKLTLLWGRKKPHDVHRRFNNIQAVYAESERQCLN